MIPSIANVAANQHLGILVIDEIQRLNLAASGGRDEMLNFFVQLVNQIGVAVVLVGTFSALDVFNGNFSQMRRGTGQGDILWDRMSFDQTWDRFIKSLWKHQFTREKISLEDCPDLSKVLYDECQGITDLAIKAYMFAQERAIETNKETINASIIRSAARDKFRIIRPAIEALRNKDKKAIKDFEDAYPEFLEKYIEGYSDWTSARDNTPPPPSIFITGEIANEPEIKEITSQFSDSNGQFEEDLIIDQQKIKKEYKKKTKSKPKGILPAISENVSGLENHCVYNALVEIGYTSPKNDLGFINSDPLAKDEKETEEKI